MLENENAIPKKKNVEEYSIEFKDNSGHQDIQTTIENNEQIEHNVLEHNDNLENNSLMFRDMLNQDSNKVEIAPHKEKVPVEAHIEHSNIQTNEISGYTDDIYYNLH